MDFGHNEDDQPDNCIGSETESEIFRMIDSNEDLLTTLCPTAGDQAIRATITDLSSSQDHQSVNRKSCPVVVTPLINEEKIGSIH